MEEEKIVEVKEYREFCPNCERDHTPTHSCIITEKQQELEERMNQSV